MHRASSLTYLDGTSLELLFMDGKTKRFDISMLFNKYPQMATYRTGNYSSPVDWPVHMGSYGMTILTSGMAVSRISTFIPPGL